MKVNNKFIKYLKKYWIIFVLIIVFVFIPKTNSRYMLKDSSFIGFKPMLYNFSASYKKTIINSSNEDIFYNVTNRNKYPVTMDILYKGTPVVTGIIITANNLNYNGNFKINPTVY